MSQNESAAGREPQAAQVVQIHAQHTPAGWRRQSPACVPSLLYQFHAPVRYAKIRGHYSYARQLEAPIIYWGRGGSCWCFMHDLEPAALVRVMADFRAATMARRMPHGVSHA